MRTDLSLEQKDIECQRNTLGEAQNSVLVAQHSNWPAQSTSPSSGCMIQSGHHLVFSKPEGCTLRGKHEFPGRSRSRIRILGDMLKYSRMVCKV